MVILPTHRVLSLDLCSEVNLSEVLDDLGQFFNLKKFKTPMNSPRSAEKMIQEKLAFFKDQRSRICMLLPNGNSYCLLLKPDSDPDEMIDSDSVRPEIKKLDVTLLDHHVIKQCWIGNPDVELEKGDIFYVKDVPSAVKLLKEKKAAVAFFLSATTLEQFHSIVSKRLRMPHKSTYFYPKLLSGFVMRDLTSGWQ